MKIARDAARQLKVELVERPVGSVEELRASLRALRPGEADAFFYVSDAMVVSQEELIIDTARAKRLPTMLSYQANVARGALASYGESYYALGRLSAKNIQVVNPRRQSRRRASRAARQAPLRHQPQDRQGTRPNDPAVAPAASGSGDRVIERREFLMTATAVVFGSAVPSGAQTSGRVPRIFLHIASRQGRDWLSAGLRELGWVDGQNVVLQWHSAEPTKHCAPRFRR